MYVCMYICMYMCMYKYICMYVTYYRVVHKIQFREVNSDLIYVYLVLGWNWVQASTVLHSVLLRMLQ